MKVEVRNKDFKYSLEFSEKRLQKMVTIVCCTVIIKNLLKYEMLKDRQA
ncbi:MULTISPECIES: hypothetical protein [Enterococcus]|uniref:Uncharacterized protein n=1 Tax=Enterococcus alishanensis TaxID=1303817 RepID=A0ABS6TDN5_9ENTE|nr:hypothetical protein [Enterococcus alishanensis]MBV7391002.1 hypothetical protein [Enterococcus alishanensis]